MDSKKTDAEKRVDALISGRDGEKEQETPPPGQAAQRLQAQKKGGEPGGRPRLTEKQRIEARQARRSKKRQKPAVTGNVLSRGIRATGIEFKRTFLFLGRSLLAGLDALKPAGQGLLRGLLALLGLLGRSLLALAGLASKLLAATGRVALAADRVLTPHRALLAVGLLAGGVLIYSQFVEFRAIEIGQPGYALVQDITHAPRVEVKTPIDTHSLILLVAGAAAIAGLALTAIDRSSARRRLFSLVVTGAGAATVLVGLLIDLPAGLETGAVAESYSGVAAVLLSGFWLELAAGGVLTITGIALLLEPSPRRVAARQSRGAGRAIAGSRA